MKISCTIVVVSFLFYYESGYCRKLHLIHSEVVWRHGDRTPLRTYPNNPNEHKWKQPLDQLTTLGMRQHYELGQYFRKRYQNLISKFYLPSEIFVLTGNNSRTISSALANLAGLYPPHSWQIFNETLNWQPIPTYQAKDAEVSIEPTWESCDAWLEERKKQESLPDYIETLQLAQPIMDFFENKTGLSLDFLTLFMLLDSFICEEVHNISHPSWLSEQDLKYSYQFSTKAFYYVFGTKLQQKLLGGVLLNKIRNTLTDVLKNKPAHKLRIYSGHDVNIAALTTLLDISNDILPPYASALMFEVYADKINGSKYLMLSFRNSTMHVPYEMRIPFCHMNILCPLSTFIDSTKSLVIEDYYRECNQLKESQEETGSYLTFYIFLALVFALFVLVCDVNVRPPVVKIK